MLDNSNVVFSRSSRSKLSLPTLTVEKSLNTLLLSEGLRRSLKRNDLFRRKGCQGKSSMHNRNSSRDSYITKTRETVNNTSYFVFFISRISETSDTLYLFQKRPYRIRKQKFLRRKHYWQIFLFTLQFIFLSQFHVTQELLKRPRSSSRRVFLQSFSRDKEVH